jgi:hypothetical protein
VIAGNAQTREPADACAESAGNGHASRPNATLDPE